MESIYNISNYFIHYFNNIGEFISNKKLQKMLYYTQAWHLVYFENKLIFEDIPEAWVHGPVYPNVYHKYKSFEFKPINPKLVTERHELNKYLESTDPVQFDFLDAIIKHYGSKSAIELELQTHREFPWLEARKGLSDLDLSANKISIKSMYDYYSSLVNNE